MIIFEKKRFTEIMYLFPPRSKSPLLKFLNQGKLHVTTIKILKRYMQNDDRKTSKSRNIFYNNFPGLRNIISTGRVT